MEEVDKLEEVFRAMTERQLLIYLCSLVSGIAQKDLETKTLIKLAKNIRIEV